MFHNKQPIHILCIYCYCVFMGRNLLTIENKTSLMPYLQAMNIKQINKHDYSIATFKFS